MADVRALLKAKRQEARITHPFASYTSAGQLRCIACGIVVKHAAAWEGHIGSKSHRMSAARLREEEARREEEERLAKKRKATPETSGTVDSREMNSIDDEELLDEMNDATSKKRRVETPPGTAFPSNFFSDSARTLLQSALDSDDEEESHRNSTVTTTIEQTSIDSEWEKFQQYINAPVERNTDLREAFDRATVFEEPQLVEQHEGFPTQGSNDEVLATPSTIQELTEQNKRQHKEQEERELIMDRLMEEERAQEEADAKVSLLKSRMEQLRQKREAARQQKASKRQ